MITSQIWNITPTLQHTNWALIKQNIGRRRSCHREHLIPTHTQAWFTFRSAFVYGSVDFSLLRAWSYISQYACMWVCLHIHIYMYICIYMYIYIYIYMNVYVVCIYIYVWITSQEMASFITAARLIHSAQSTVCMNMLVRTWSVRVHIYTFLGVVVDRVCKFTYLLM